MACRKSQQLQETLHHLVIRTHKNPESEIYYCEGIVDEQPVKAIDDSDTLGQLPGGGNQILIIDEQVKNQWKTKK
ncbi:hypothetical protein Asn12ST33_06140 [Cutibacterium acnes]|nr:hypothetical protein Asn12ST33_06140 [Cutibacterium acnes]